jgi:DHA1 family 2-module integral membrane pump EmrD-like MFS transporter
LVPETAPKLDPKATRLATISKNYKHLVCHPVFCKFVLCASLTMGSIIVFYTLTAFVMLHQFNLNPAEYGWFIFSVTIMMVFSRAINIVLVRKFSNETCINSALVSMFFASVMLLLLNLTSEHETLMRVSIPMTLYIISTGIIFPNASVGALTPFRHMAGSAGAVYGSLQTFGSFFATLIASMLPDTLLVLALILLVISGSLLLVFNFLSFVTKDYGDCSTS